MTTHEELAGMRNKLNTLEAIVRDIADQEEARLTDMRDSIAREVFSSVVKRTSTPPPAQEIAAYAYAYADAMIDASRKRSQT